MTQRGPVYLDACAIIELLEKRTPAADALLALVDAAKVRPSPLVTSELSLTEVLVGPLQDLATHTPHEDQAAASRDARDWYLANLVEDGILIRTLAITRTILTRAALMRARVPSLRVPDAIHVATAAEMSCTHVITGDQRLIRAVERDSAGNAVARTFAFVPLDAGAIDALARHFDA